MTEQLQNDLNNPTSTLNANITNSATTLDVASGHGARFPSSGNFRIRISSELILVGARSGDTLSSLTRGIESTSAAAHSSGDNVDLIVTKGGLDQYLSEHPAALVATSIAALPDSPTEGTLAQLRLGSSPYEFIALVYDATLAKWVSAVLEGPSQDMATAETTTSISYAEITSNNIRRALIPHHKLLYDAGLRVQVLVAGFLVNSGANTTTFRASLKEFSDGDTATSANVGTGSDRSLVGATAKFVLGDWEDITYSSGPAKTHGLLYFEEKVSAGTGSYSRLACKYRWAATAA